MHPVPHPITTPYGVEGSWAAGYHTGDDYACPTGTPVQTTAGGKCAINEWDDSYGYYVAIDTDGVRHMYCHLREPGIIWPGMECHAGTGIGWSGSTGNSTGPHLHYEERVAPFGYWDHRKPQFNHQPEGAPPPTDEEVLMALPAVIFFRTEGAWYASYPLAGVFRGLGGGDMDDIKTVLKRSGHTWSVHSEEPVANTDAFGVQIQ
jgi:hypothetical protein